MKTYLVGGAVRDMVMGRIPKDRDFVVVGATPEIMFSKGFTQVGADFPVFLHPVTNEEYALARIERKNGKGYHGFDVDFSSDVTLEEDLARRDLTMNAMAIDCDAPILDIIDPFGGQADVKKGIIRHTSEAFKEDPVRILRAARFAGRYAFNIAPETMKFMSDMVAAGDMQDLTAERVWIEFEKGLMEEFPWIMLDYLVYCGADKYLPMFDCVKATNSLIKAAGVNLPLECRFALISSPFKTEQDYQDARIPSACKDMSKLFNRESDNIFNYGNMTIPERIQMFTRADIFRKPDRFNSLIATCIQVVYKKVAVQAICDDIDRVMKVNAGEIAMQCTDKSKIKDAIFDARVRALTP